QGSNMANTSRDSKRRNGLAVSHSKGETCSPKIPPSGLKELTRYRLYRFLLMSLLKLYEEALQEVAQLQCLPGRMGGKHHLLLRAGLMLLRTVTRFCI